MQSSITILPHTQKRITLAFKAVPPDLQSSNLLIHMDLSQPQGWWQAIMVNMKNNCVQVLVINDSDKAMKLKRGKLVVSADMRSIGYFWQTRDALQAVLQQDALFLSEQETAHYVDQCFVGQSAKAQSTWIVKTETPQETPLTEFSEKVAAKNKDEYPWLKDDDPRWTMTDKQIFEQYVDLSESDLTAREKWKMIHLLMKYRPAFSLRDKLGKCPKLKVHLELHDESPFFIRPCNCTEDHKKLINKQMRHRCLLGILKKGLSFYSSPIMLIPHKHTKLVRINTDFWVLNLWLVKLNPSIPLVRDAIQMLRAAECEVISICDLWDAYHSMLLDEYSKHFCGIIPYYRSSSYIYQRLGMGLSVSPAIWQYFFHKIMEEIPDWCHHFAIMDDCLIHSSKEEHWYHLTNLFKSLIKHGLKMSPKKCQFFHKKLTYMGHTIIIDGTTPCITAHKSRIDAIQKLNQPKTAQDCKSFCGMVNFLSMYLKDLQSHLIPIYELTKKNHLFVWGEEQ